MYTDGGNGLENLKYVLFDLDGTITDPKEGITKSIQYSLRKFGIEVEDLDSLCPFIGPPLSQSYEKFYGFSHEQAMEAVDEYRVYYRKKGIFECYLYEGIRELVKDLHESGIKVILATSKPEEFAVQLLEHFDILKYFDVVAGSTMDGSRVEKVDVIKHAVSRLSGFRPEEAVMVGDRKFDYIGAKECNIPCILIGYGYGEMQELEECKPFAIKSTVSELKEYLFN